MKTEQSFNVLVKPKKYSLL